MAVADDVALTDWGMMHFGHAYRPAWCPRSPLVSRRITGIVLKYLIAKPAKRHEPAAEDVYMALSEAFPCRGSERAPNR